MSVQRSQPPPLPGWLMILGSAFVVFHLLAIGVLVLSAPSGPWLAPPPFPPSQVEGPRFALGIAELTTAYYLRPLKMTHNYHFLGNRPDAPGVTFEVRLKDADGHVSETLHFPSPRANAWLRYRHTLLAQNRWRRRAGRGPTGRSGAGERPEDADDENLGSCWPQQPRLSRQGNAPHTEECAGFAPARVDAHHGPFLSATPVP